MISTQRRVLIAEDWGLIAEELRDRLEHMGLSVVGVAASGEAAIAQAREVLPDLVLMDIRLKGRIDGIEAATEIRQQLKIPIIYVTAHSDDATIARAKKTEPVGYVIKPFTEQELRVAIDMGLHKHATEWRLNESREFFATTLASIADAVIATTVDGEITFMNRAAEALTGWRAADALHRPLYDVFQIVDAATRTVPESPVARALRNGAVATLPDGVQLVTKNGVEIPIADTAAVVRDDEGQVRGAVLVFRDVSSRLRAQEALRDAEDRLRQSQKLEAIGRLAGGVAHDINNLMTVVIGCGSMLLDDLEPATRHHAMVEEMKHAGERAATLAHQLLAFGRKQILVSSVVSLNDLVSRAEGLIRRIIGEDITVMTRLRPDMGRVKVDPGQMEQVLVNLAVNARDAMPQGGALTFVTGRAVADGTFSVEAPEVQPGKYAVLSVTDTGSGMDVETKARIFEPFFTTKQPGEGTGLGLATVYGIVKQSGGYIYVHSHPGQGTTFKIYLPEVEDPATLVATGERHAPVPGSETILLVEDDGSVRSLARTILERAGYTVLEAADGSEALRLYKHRPGVDLLLTDAIMPVMGGRALAERLAIGHPRLKVLFMSGYTEDHVLRHGVQDANVPFIQKPFSPSDLTGAIRRAIDAADPSDH
jgi:two-component system, cell cycle sensor histidine kinase and response regulator CckA